MVEVLLLLVVVGSFSYILRWCCIKCCVIEWASFTQLHLEARGWGLNKEMKKI